MSRNQRLLFGCLIFFGLNHLIYWGPFDLLVCFAQSTTVTGQVKDLNGIPYAGAQMKAQLVFAGTPVSNPTVQISNLAQCKANGFGSSPCNVPFTPNQGPFNLDGGGNLPGGGITLQDTSLVTPAGTQWLFTANTNGNPPPLGTGPQTCNATIAITGASQSISTNFAACPALSNVTGGGGGGGGGLGAPALPATANLLAENLLLDGSGTVMSDSSGNGGTCTLAGGGAAPTVNPVASGGGLTFTGSSNQFCAYPASVNSAKTFLVALSFQTGVTPGPSIQQFLNEQLLSGSNTVATSLNWQLYDIGTSDTWSPGGQGAVQFRTNATTAAVWNASSACTFLGTGVIGLTLAASDTFYINGQPCINRQNGSSLGQQSAGVLQLGGSSALGGANQFFTGTVYCFAAWSIVLTPVQVAQASQALQSACLQQRGIIPFLGGVSSSLNGIFTQIDARDVLVLEGDSIFAGINVPSQGLAGQPVMTADIAISSTGALGMFQRFPLDAQPLYRAGANRNVFIEWGGTNDMGTTPVPTVVAQLQSTARLAEQVGFKSVFATMISRVTNEVNRDKFNPLIRQYLPLYSSYPGILDLGANTHLGCDGCSANTTYFNVDQVHLTNFSSVNIVGPYYVHAFNRATGNKPGSGFFNIYSGTGFTIPTLLQSVDCANLSGTPVTCTLPWPLTAGSLVVTTANCASCSSVTINVPTDSQGLTYTALTATNNYNTTAQLRSFFAPNSTAAADTITYTLAGGTVQNLSITVQEFSGVATTTPLDVASAVAAGTSVTPAGPSVTTTATGDLLLGYVGLLSGANLGQFTPIGTFIQPVAPLVLANDLPPVGNAYTVSGAAGSYSTSSVLPVSQPWGAGTAAFKAIAGTSTYQLQDVDIYAECSPNGTNNVALILPDGTWMTGGTITIKNNQTSGAATCVVNAPTPYQTGVQQTIDGATSVTIANKATAVFKCKYSFTGTPGTTLVPVITWELLQNN